MNENIIVQFLHCKKCSDEKPTNKSPREWARMESGWTVQGLQIWCVRHNENIINLDFKGQKIAHYDDGR